MGRSRSRERDRRRSRSRERRRSRSARRSRSRDRSREREQREREREREEARKKEEEEKKQVESTAQGLFGELASYATTDKRFDPNAFKGIKNQLDPNATLNKILEEPQPAPILQADQPMDLA